MAADGGIYEYRVVGRYKLLHSQVDLWNLYACELGAAVNPLVQVQ